MGDQLWLWVGKLAGLAGWPAFFLALAALYFRTKPALEREKNARAQLEQTGALALNTMLMARVGALEAAREADRKDCERQLTDMRHDFEGQLATLRAEYEGLLRQFRQVESSTARSIGKTPPDFEALADKIAEKRGGGGK